MRDVSEGAGGLIEVGAERDVSTAVSAPRVGRAVAGANLLAADVGVGVFFFLLLVRPSSVRDVEARSDDRLVITCGRGGGGRWEGCAELRPGPREGADDI